MRTIAGIFLSADNSWGEINVGSLALTEHDKRETIYIATLFIQ